MDVIKLRSSIRSDLKRSLLLKGTALAAGGAFLILASGAFLPPDSLTKWGLPILLLSGFLIAVGLLPYRRLCRLEMKPNEILITDDQNFLYLENGQPALTISFASIREISYRTLAHDYGIAIWLNPDSAVHDSKSKDCGDLVSPTAESKFVQPIPEKIIVHDSRSRTNRYVRPWAKRFGCDLFLPYFTERSCEELQKFINQSE